MLWARIGVYHTQFSVAYFLVSTLLSKIFDVGDRDLPVLTSGNWVIKGWVIKCIACETMYVFCVFNVFFQNPKNMTFDVFWVADHIFSNTVLEARRPTERAVKGFLSGRGSANPHQLECLGSTITYPSGVLRQQMLLVATKVISRFNSAEPLYATSASATGVTEQLGSAEPWLKKHWHTLKNCMRATMTQKKAEQQGWKNL